MSEPVRFQAEITLSKDDALDRVARCEEAVERAETADEAELAFLIEGLRRFPLGRLMSDITPLDG